jgi:hypothetical protein
MKNYLIFIPLILLLLKPFNASLTLAQETTKINQNIRGVVTDRNLGFPITGAYVVVLETNPLIGAVTDAKGEFKLPDVPLGRHTLQISIVGYKTATIPSLLLTSGSELIIPITLEEQVVEINEVVIKASSKERPNNDMALISARSFTVEETEKYAGSWGDPSRMATNYAGVMASSDQNNDIVIRGNSPNGLLWKLEGLNIPNPNHFGGMGATGGPISMLNNNVLANSDFFTGAFPAEYGNAISGVFDLQMRNGNNEKREYLAQMGFNGFELGAEGPFSKKSRASYLANYRYSIMGTFDLLGIDMGIGAIPYYQDLSAKIDLPSTKAGNFSIFGLWGKDEITFDDTTERSRFDQHYESQTSVLGLSHSYFFKNNARIKTTIGYSNKTDLGNSKYFKDDTLSQHYDSKLSESQYSIISEYKKKINSKNTLVFGFDGQLIQFKYLDSTYIKEYGTYITNFDISGTTSLLQAYTMWEYKLSNQMKWVGGLHYQYLTHNGDMALEPRFSFEWKYRPKQSLTFGYGLHSQMQPRIVYFEATCVDTLNQVYEKYNEDLGFTKSHHFVLGYHYMINPNLRFIAEAYYQYLYNVPVSSDSSFFSMINYGSSQYVGDYEKLVNEGTGRNYGIDLTFEHFLVKNFYYMCTVSLFDSKYKGSDGVLRNTLYNGNWVFNVLGGYEYSPKGKNSFCIDSKFVWAGGLRDVEVDEEASIADDETVYDFNNAFASRGDDYYRLDLRLSYKINARRYMLEFALDMTNITNHKNSFMEYYNPDTEEVEKIEMGIVPVMLIRCRF